MMDILHFLAPYLGVIGSFLFAMVNIPVIIKIHMDKSTKGTSFIFVLMSFFANICCGTFVLDNNLTTGVWQYPLYGNYGFAFLCCCYMMFLFRKYRKK